MYIYIYIERERDRERSIYIYIYIYISIHTYTHIYIYIFIERERDLNHYLLGGMGLRESPSVRRAATAQRGAPAGNRVSQLTAWRAVRQP